MTRIIRPFHVDDAPQLLQLFEQTIRHLNAADYTPEQISAWASDEIDEAEWAARFSGRIAIVVEVNDRPLGFAEMKPDGHIDRFYVSAAHQRQGLGRALMKGLVTHARLLRIHGLSADVSITARPFFERQGFVLVAPQTVTLRGVEFLNYRMTKSLK